MKSHRASSRILALVFLICIHFLACHVSSLDTLKQGDRLHSSSQLVSAKNIFTLGFYIPTDTNNSYLAIWYTDRPTYPAWIGNRENPIPTNTTSFNLTITSTGNLIITTQNGRDSVEIFHAGESSRNASATLLDSGNFVLRDFTSSSNGEIIWQSFDYPTDTLLPGMKLGLDNRTGRRTILRSWFGENNPASGAFTLEWDTNERMLIVRRRGVVYWRSGRLRDFYDESYDLPLKEFDNMVFKPDPSNFNYNFTNITTNNEEYFTYSLFIVQDTTPDERKIISGWRLNYQGDTSEIDTRRGFLLVRASLCYGYQNRDYKGCELWEQPTCRNDRQTFVRRSGDFRPVNGQIVPSNYDANSSLSESDCREICWDNCECAAYTDGYESDGSGCVYWIGSNLEFEQSLEGTAVRKYVLDSAPINNTTSNLSRGMKKHIQIILIVVSTIVLLVLVIAFFVIRKFKKGKREEELNELLTLEGYTETYEFENVGGAKGNDLRMFTYASIQSATNSFSSDYKLGQGGFGPVYKGKTAEGQDIAVKLLSRQSGQGLLEFKTELVLISKLQHVNLVKLLGFCIHGDDKMIVYDYMSNKSLDFFLFSPSKRELLDWERRFNIIEGIAQGLLYLHKYSRVRIIHRDLKPGNILLDQNMNPKISDFGLARIFKQNIEEANTNRRVGTYGYMAPEYAMQGIFSIKSDVYSFGVLVLEIVSGRKNNSFHQIEGPLNLVEYAWELWSKDSAVELVDPTLRTSCIMDQVQRCVHIGLLCVENHTSDRPTIEDVISMLKNEMTTLPMPKNPAFITRNRVVEQVGKNSTPEKLTANELTVSELGGR